VNRCCGSSKACSGPCGPPAQFGGHGGPRSGQLGLGPLRPASGHRAAAYGGGGPQNQIPLDARVRFALHASNLPPPSPSSCCLSPPASATAALSVGPLTLIPASRAPRAPPSAPVPPLRMAGGPPRTRRGRCSEPERTKPALPV
jgi:hypothetical protein